MPGIAVAALILLTLAVGILGTIVVIQSRDKSDSNVAQANPVPDTPVANPPPVSPGAPEVREALPSSGVLLPDDVAQTSAGALSALRALAGHATAPLALEYHPVAPGEVRRFRQVPVNSTIQQGLVHAVQAFGSKQETLFRVILPAGETLTRAAGGVGFRGFAMASGKISSQARLIPAGAAVGLAAAWPLMAVGASVMALDALAQREQRAFQERVDTFIARQEHVQWRDRVARQRSIDERISAAIHRVLDGSPSEVGLVLQLANEEFQKSRMFYDRNRDGAHRVLLEARGHAKHECDRWRVSKELFNGEEFGIARFAGELQFARAGISLQQRALVLEAANAAISDPTNPYRHLRRELDRQARVVQDVADDDEWLTNALTEINIRRQLMPAGLVHVPIWQRDDQWRDELHGSVARVQVAAPAEQLYLARTTGEVVQLLEA